MQPPPLPVQCPNCSEVVPETDIIPIGEDRVCPHCRSLYLQRMKEGLPPEQNSHARAVRQVHLKHEASLRSVGILYFLSCAVLLFISVTLVSLGGLAEEPVMLGGLIAFYFGLGVLLFFMGRGMRKLQRWVRIPATILAVLGLLQFPVGTLINGYILALIWSEKGKMVFSDPYARIIAETPDMKYQTSIFVKVLLGFLLLIVGSLVVVALMEL